MLIDASPQDRWWQDVVSVKTFDTQTGTHALPLSPLYASHHQKHPQLW